MPSRGGEVLELIKHVRAGGFKVTKTGNQKHYKVLTKSGAVVKDENGPVIISSSPSDMRWREMHVRRLMAAGVLAKDPYKATGQQTRGAKETANGDGGEPAAKEKRRTPLNDPEQSERIHAAKVAAIRAKGERQAEETGKQRARLEPIVPHLGGWGERGAPARTIKQGDPISARTRLTTQEFADVCHHWARTRGRTELPKDPKTNTYLDPRLLASAVGSMKLGHTVGGKWLPLITIFLDDLWREANHDPRNAAARYLELLREAKGLIDTPETPRPLPPSRISQTIKLVPPQPEQEEDQQQENGHAAIGPLHDGVKAPKDALRAMWYMARGATPEELNDILEIGEHLAELELSARR